MKLTLLLKASSYEYEPLSSSFADCRERLHENEQNIDELENKIERTVKVSLVNCFISHLADQLLISVEFHTSPG